MKPHTHQELIKLWADGHQIQWKTDEGEWIDCYDVVEWWKHREYRIKPKPDPYQHLKEAHARGEEIEFLIGDKWWAMEEGEIKWHYPVEHYRIAAKKELPPKQPLSMEFFGSNGTIWLHSKAGGRIAMVVEFSEEGVLLGNDDRSISYHQLMDEPYGWEWGTSPNGPFQPCYT